MKVLSLFDGMSCGMIAFKELGIEVESYDAYEIDKYAVQTSEHNFPQIKHHGDVFKADFTDYEGYDFVIGGSPCTYWSIAQQPNKRETVASGMGWELFSQYVRAVKEAKPKYFLYENNKSMSKAIRQSICETFGFEPILINSSLVSAQNRQRLYWCGIRQEDGTYAKADIKQPKDLGIILKDILEKGQDLCASYQGIVPKRTLTKSSGNVVAEPIGVTNSDKSFAVTAYYSTGQNPEHTLKKHVGTMVAKKVNEHERLDDVKYCNDKNMKHLMRQYGSGGKIVSKETEKSPTLLAAMGSGGGNGVYTANTVEPINVSEGGKSHTIKSQYAKNGLANFTNDNKKGMRYAATGVAESVCVAQRGRYSDTGKRNVRGSGKIEQYYEARCDNKTNTLTTVQKDNMVAESMVIKFTDQPTHNTKVQCVGAYPKDDGALSGFEQSNRIYSADGKACTQTANGGGKGSNTGLYALKTKKVGNIPNEDGKMADHVQNRVYSEDGKGCTVCTNSTSSPSYAMASSEKVYEVSGGYITIKGKQYPIKLKDGYYIIRKLTVRECARLQTVPEWYEFPVSKTQAYKQLGNGWTVRVIMHLIKGLLNGEVVESVEQLKLF